MENKTKLALAMIVKGDDEEAKILDRCLGGVTGELSAEHENIDLTGTDGIAKHVDGIFLTITQPNEACEAVAKKYGATVSHYEWDKSFANARNFNFKQVPQEYSHIVWCDTDDVWWHPELLRKTVELMSVDAVDYVHLNYMYHFDEYGSCDTQHVKTRIIVNDGSVVWAGAVHEDFTTERQITGMLATELAVYHLTDWKRINESTHRNTDIAKNELKKSPDDPRSYWNVANAAMMEQKYEEAISVYLEFLDKSESEEERYLAWHRIAQCYYQVEDFDRALACETEAITIRPWYPDAYFGMGDIFLRVGKYRHAKEMLEAGLAKPKPETEIIVWNPRDYDFNPRMRLAEAFMKMYKPKDALKQLTLCSKIFPKNKHVKKLIKLTSPEVKKFTYVDKLFKEAQKAKTKEEIRELLEKVPEELQHYPPVVNLRNVHFTKTESSGKDVVIFCGYTSHEWSPHIFSSKGVGGSEEAVIQLAKRWKSLGWNVTVYANIGHKETVFDGVVWKPFMSWNYRDKQDVVIIWRHPKPVDYDINADKIIIDVHDVIPKSEFTPKRLSKIHKVVFKSWAHRNYCDNVPDDKCIVVPHGLDIAKFDDRAGIITKDPYKIVNTSSPDRSLLTSIDIVERVYEKLPEELKHKLRFRWNYGFRVWDADFSDNEKMMAWKSKALKKLEGLVEKGIIESGSGDMISQNEVVDQYLNSGLMLYPSEFFEIGFISGIKAALAGAIPVTTDVFAQGEFLKDGIVVHSDVGYDNWQLDIKEGVDYGVKTEEQKEEFANKIVEYMKNPEKYESQRQKLMEYARNTFDWDKTAKSWTEIF